MYSRDESEDEEKPEISQWANEILQSPNCYGSDTSISYSAVNICGRPSKFPTYGDFAECFSLRRYGPQNETEFSLKDQPEFTFHDFITIKYEFYVLPTEIRIFETYHPGSVVRIFCYCSLTKRWKLLWQQAPAPVEKKAREFKPPIKKINSPTRILRIEFNLSLIDYYTGIDGVLLRGFKCKQPIEKPLSEQAVIMGIIQKKLETVHFKPQKTPSEAIEEFLKNDLNKFIENVGLESSTKSDKIKPQVELDGNKEKRINDIPYEVLFNIMTYLDLKSLYHCSHVCRAFRSLANDPLLYTEVNLKFYWNLANSALMESLTSRCSLIRKLDLSSCGFFQTIKSVDFNNFLHVNGRSLTNLRLDSSQFLNTSCLETISITCDNLTELSLKNYMNVTTDRDFVSLSLLKRLEILDLSRSGIDMPTLINILKNNPNLRTLNLAFASPTVWMDEICMQILLTNRNIRSIDMWKCHNLTTVGLRALSQCIHLEELDFGWCLREEPTITESFKQLILNCRNLKKLVLAAVRGITERDLENVASFCENLEHLDLMGIVGVSSEMCLRILQNCTSLKLLDVSFCENLDDVNIMRWRNDYGVCIKRSEVPNDG